MDMQVRIWCCGHSRRPGHAVTCYNLQGTRGFKALLSLRCMLMIFNSMLWPAGLLACLALRYDASRSTDMRARAVAAADAINIALKDLDPGASSMEVANATANAAEAAYDQVSWF